MKTDDLRLEESLKRLTERIKKIDDTILTVLKNHVAVEQFMGEFLEAHGKKSDNLTFADKITACKARNPSEIEKPIWDLLKACNRLRNTVAHKLDEKEMKAQMDAVRAAYIAAVTEFQAKFIKDLDDVRMAMGALQLCGSYIVVATEAVPPSDVL
jgi:chorismate mutase